MLQHFTFQPVLSKTRRREWIFSFYYRGRPYKGVYRYNGKIDWRSEAPAQNVRRQLESEIHGLMLFHVYDHL